MTDITETIARLRALAKAVHISSVGMPIDRSDAANEYHAALEAAAPALLDAAEDRQQKLLRVLDEIARRRRAEHDMRRAEAERDRLRERVGELEEGLRPFSEIANSFNEAFLNSDRRCWVVTPVSDFRRARALLNQETT